MGKKRACSCIYVTPALDSFKVEQLLSFMTEIILIVQNSQKIMTQEKEC